MTELLTPPRKKRNPFSRGRHAVRMGVEGNSRLTSATALVLLILLAIEGVTVLRVRSLLTPHVLSACCSYLRSWSRFQVPCGALATTTEARAITAARAHHRFLCGFWTLCHHPHGFALWFRCPPSPRTDFPQRTVTPTAPGELRPLVPRHDRPRP